MLIRRPTVIVFTKAARLGAVKTRLAADIGEFAAWRFQRDQGRRLIARLASEGFWNLVLANYFEDMGPD